MRSGLWTRERARLPSWIYSRHGPQQRSSDLWRAAKTDGLLVDPIDGDWQPPDSVKATRLALPRMRVVSGAAADSTLREFLQLVLR